MRFYLLVLAIAGIGVAASTALARQPLADDPRHPAATIAAGPAQGPASERSEA